MNPSRRNARWTDEEYEQLAAWRAEGLTYAEIAEKLGRTPQSVCARASTRGIVMPKSTCRHCGKELVRVNSGRPPEYCSDQCRRDSVNERERIRTRQLRADESGALRCEQCGVELPEGRLRRYCSRECGQRHWYESALKNGTRTRTKPGKSGKARRRRGTGAAIGQTPVERGHSDHAAT